MAKGFGWKGVSKVCGDGVIRKTDEVYSLTTKSYDSAVVPIIPSLPINHSSTIIVESEKGTKFNVKYSNGKISSVSEE